MERLLSASEEGQNNESIGQFFAVVNKGLLQVFGSLDRSIVFIQTLQCMQCRCISGTASTTHIYEAVCICKYVRQLECNLSEKKLYSFMSAFPYDIMDSISNWKSVIIKCLSGNAGEQRHAKMDSEL